MVDTELLDVLGCFSPRLRSGFWGERYKPVKVADLDFGCKPMER